MTLPSCALLLIESFKFVITELNVLNDLNKRISVLVVINAISKNTTDYIKIENAGLNDALIKLQDRVDDHEQRNRYLWLLFFYLFFYFIIYLNINAVFIEV